MKYLAAIVVLLLVLFSGCIQNGGAPGQALDKNARFILPDAPDAYFARYTIEEGGPMTKEVWREGGSMRTDLNVQGQHALSFFFINSRAYSCTYISSAPACYDVTPILSQSDAQRLVPSEADVAGAMRVESVKIGDTTGTCYETQIALLGARKLCFAVGGVVAYDSYNVSKTVAHTEYLTDLQYYPTGSGPDEGVFSLPAQPTVAPGAPEPPVVPLEE